MTGQVIKFPMPRPSTRFEDRVTAGRAFFLALDPRRDEAKATDIARRMAARCEELEALQRAKTTPAAQVLRLPLGK